MATQTSAKENKGQKATGFIKGSGRNQEIAWPTRKQLVQYDCGHHYVDPAIDPRVWAGFHFPEFNRTDYSLRRE